MVILAVSSPLFGGKPSRLDPSRLAAGARRVIISAGSPAEVFRPYIKLGWAVHCAENIGWSRWHSAIGVWGGSGGCIKSWR